MIEQCLHSIRDFFSFNPEKPLLFTEIHFWVFFSVVLLLYSFIHKRIFIRTIYLLLVSYFFYYKTSGVFLLLMIFTIFSDYHWGKWISQSTVIWKKKLFLSISVCLNLFLLGYFKYAYFFNESFNQFLGTQHPFFNHFAQFSNTFFQTKFNVSKLILPVGISFFTFQSLSYIIDIYRDKVKPVAHIADYGFFVCFFPHLVAGPIVKAHEFLHQIYQPYQLRRHDFGLALFWILNGLSKKIMADYLAVNFIDRIFDNPHLYSGTEVSLGILGYSLQIYADFSGYTDIAIGVALLLGFRLKTNFNSPYKAQSTSEFWQRWHISLSSWLKEYLYIPLGGNKVGSIGSYVCIVILSLFMILLSGESWLIYVLAGLTFWFCFFAYFFQSFRQHINTNINLLVTMLLGGLWHGSSWMFLIWGGLNGIGLMIHKAWQKINPIKNQQVWWYRILAILITLVFISFTRIWFRSDALQTVGTLFDRMQHHFGINLIGDILIGYKHVMALMVVGYVIHWLPETWKEKYRNFFAQLPIPVLIPLCLLILFALYQCMSSEMQPFIYFQF